MLVSDVTVEVLVMVAQLPPAPSVQACPATHDTPAQDGRRPTGGNQAERPGHESHRLDGRNPFRTVQKPWKNDDSPVNTNNDLFLMDSECRILSIRRVEVDEPKFEINPKVEDPHGVCLAQDSERENANSFVQKRSQRRWLPSPEMGGEGVPKRWHTPL